MPKSRRGQHLLSTFKALDKKLDAHHVIVAEKSATVSVRFFNEYGQKIKTATELHDPSATAQLNIVVIPPNKFLNPNPSRIAKVKYREIQQQMMLLDEQKHDGLFPIVRNEVELELPQLIDPIPTKERPKPKLVVIESGGKPSPEQEIEQFEKALAAQEAQRKRDFEEAIEERAKERRELGLDQT